MTIIQKWRLMMASFADIAAAITEKGVTIHDSKGYSSYANAVRQIYSGAHTDEYEYPVKKQNPVMYALELIVWCKTIKEQIRQAIIDGGVDCGETVPLSAYGDKIRQINTLEIVTTYIDIGEWGTPCNVQLYAKGGTPPYKWKANGWWVFGTTLSEDGIISGTPTQPSASNNKIKVTDAAGRTSYANVITYVYAQTLQFKCVGGACFQYTGQPQQLNIICTNKPDAEFRVVYGTEKTESVTECGSYLARVILTGETASSYRYRTDYETRIEIIP